MREIEARKITTGRSAKEPFALPCLFGVSVDVGNARVLELKAGWQWTQQRFARCSILLGDSLQRLTIQARLGIDYQESKVAAECQSSELEGRLRKTLGDSVPLIKTSTVAQDYEFATRLQLFQSVFDEWDIFREAVLVDAHRYCERQVRRQQLQISYSEALDLAVKYIIEEITVYDVLARDEWLVECYIGNELFALSQFMHGRFRGLAPRLEMRTHICLYVPKESVS